MTYIAGVEEAGRGPVIGPMVIAITVIEREREDYLREIGVRDSKQLTSNKRETLFELLVETLTNYKYVIIPPQEIDIALTSGSTNLNWLEADKMIELMKCINDHTKIDEVFIDCPSTNTKSYLSYLEKQLKIKPSCLIVEHKADQRYPIASAASIIAKVIRDQEIKKIQEEHNVNFGSGYTSDPYTIDFLKTWVQTHKKYPDFVRTSWVTAKKIMNQRFQRELTNY